jgi:hypothetical protein
VAPSTIPRTRQRTIAPFYHNSRDNHSRSGSKVSMEGSMESDLKLTLKNSPGLYEDIFCAPLCCLDEVVRGLKRNNTLWYGRQAISRKRDEEMDPSSKESTFLQAGEHIRRLQQKRTLSRAARLLEPLSTAIKPQNASRDLYNQTMQRQNFSRSGLPAHQMRQCHQRISSMLDTSRLRRSAKNQERKRLQSTGTRPGGE